MRISRADSGKAMAQGQVIKRGKQMVRGKGFTGAQGGGRKEGKNNDERWMQ